MRNGVKSLLPILLLGSAVLLLIFTRENNWDSFVMVVAMAVNLLAAYQFGAGVGCLVGTFVGILVNLSVKDAGIIGIMASMGAMAGAFQSIGKWAGSLAFLLAGVELGVLYAPDMLQQFWDEALVSVLFLFLLPKEWFRMPQKQQRKPENVEIYDGEGLLGEKLGRVSEAFTLLGKNMMKTGDEHSFEDSHMGEVRETVASQYMELANLLEHFREDIGQETAFSKEIEKKMRKCLKEKRIQAEQLAMWTRSGVGKKIMMTLRTENGSCVAAKEVAEWMSREINCKLYPSKDSRMVVTGNSTMIQLEEAPQYYMIHAVARATKTEESVSGDCFSFLSLPDGNQLMAVCDGMGSGSQAAAESKQVIELTEAFMEAGFSPTSVIRLVNNAIMLQNEDPHPITMDLIKINLHLAHCSFIKAGASISCIRRGDKVEIMQAESLPMGSIPRMELMEKSYRLQSGDIIIMVTDGVIEAFEGEEKEAAFCDYVLGLKMTNVKDMANHILMYAMSQNPEEVCDDMLVLAAGIWKKQESSILSKGA
ncbi:MAG: SpoIIE family protein phosphatase [Lachnospiraceae bacterium]